jgi:urease accessory protein
MPWHERPLRAPIGLIVLSLVVWAACPQPAQAHLVNSGLGPFYDGVAHLFVTPDDLLVVLALALLAGLRGQQAGRTVLLLLPLAWLAGAIAARAVPAAAGFAALSAALLVVVGLLTASDLRVPVRALAGLALAAGLTQGYRHGAALAQATSSSLAAGGTVCAVFVVAALVAGQVVGLHRQAARIAVRVAGSWIGAIGLLLLGWAAR